MKNYDQDEYKRIKTESKLIFLTIISIVLFGIVIYEIL